MGNGGYMLVGNGGCWWIYFGCRWVVVGGGGWWWVMVDIFWLVVDGNGYILAGDGWLWVLVGGGINYSNPIVTVYLLRFISNMSVN